MGNFSKLENLSWTIAAGFVAVIGLTASGSAWASVPNDMVDRPGSDTLSYSFKSFKLLPNLSTAELIQKVNEFNAAEGEISYAPDGTIQTRKLATEYANLADTVKLRATTSLNTPVALVAAQWPANGPQPVAVLGRTYKGGKWGKWENVGDEIEESRDGLESATDAWVVTNAAKAEIALVMGETHTRLRPQLVVIDPGSRAADRKYALPTSGSTKAKETPSTRVYSQADGKDEEENTSDPNKDDSGNPVQPQPPANLWSQVPEVPGPVEVHSREEWGADPSLMKWTPRPGKVQAAIVHHTAGQNDYPPEAVPGILRAIYRYHAKTRGWGDIGYNVLVDNFGRAWQGRAGNFWSYNSIGAHTLSLNQSAFGISVLGNYQDFRPSDAAIATVAKVIAYKLPTGLDPLKLSTPVAKRDGTIIHIPVISGHRDVNSTSCPGQAFYDYLPVLRQKVAAYIAQPGLTVKEPDKFKAQRQQAMAGIPTQLAGSDRIGTSIAIATSAFPEGAKTVYVARADSIADALAGGSLTDGPIVLVSDNDTAISQVSEYIASSGALQVVALGGTNAISDQTLTAVSGNAKTWRLAGDNRAGTAAEIAKAVARAHPDMKTVYLAEQNKGIDALAAGSLNDGPVLLVPTQGEVPASVREAVDAIKPNRVVALGGAKAVSDQMLSQVASGRATMRIAGSDRYHTSREISRYRYPNGCEQVYLASGINPVDAVAGGVLTKGPILLVPGATGHTLDRRTGDEISRLKSKYVTALGGEKAVAQELILQAFIYTNS